MRATTLAAVVLALLACGPARPERALPAGPRIQVKPSKIDFGEVKADQSVVRVVAVSNVGTQTLRLASVSTTCGCTVAVGFDREVPSGGSTSLKVSLNTRGLAGHVVRGVLIRSNDPQEPNLEIVVTAAVEAK